MNLENRIEKLEKLVKNISDKLSKKDFESTDKYLNQYEHYKINEQEICNDYLYSDNFESYKNNTDTITSESKEEIYPHILGSWSQANETKNDIKIKNLYGKIIYKFPVYHLEWEMDGYGYIIQNQKGHKQIIMTDHGAPYISNITELKSKISTYNSIIQKTNKAIDIYLTNDA